MKKILVVAAHPDDEILGCAGTLARLNKDGYNNFVLILGEGATSRDNIRMADKRKKEIERLKTQDIEANKIIGTKKVYFENFPDNSFDSVPLLGIVKAIERIKAILKPDIIFTHYSEDLNIDHRITFQAVLTAFRPLEEERAKEIYSFEVPSSTEWNHPLKFSPNLFFDIEDTIDLKSRALKKYTSELRAYPHPRSLKGIKIKAMDWGVKIGIKYAEAFQIVRIIK